MKIAVQGEKNQGAINANKQTIPLNQKSTVSNIKTLQVNYGENYGVFSDKSHVKEFLFSTSNLFKSKHMRSISNSPQMQLAIFVYVHVCFVH